VGILEVVLMAAGMTKQQIKQRFANAGWQIDDGFSEYLLIGCSSDTLSIVNHRGVVQNPEGDQLFEILDHIRNVTYWVREVPTPHQAAMLLEEHGRPPQEWDEP
jgi:hypothetical protein